MNKKPFKKSHEGQIEIRFWVSKKLQRDFKAQTLKDEKYPIEVFRWLLYLYISKKVKIKE